MSNRLQFAISIMLLPAFAEAVNSEYMVDIPYFPLSLGRLMFVIVGFWGLYVYGTKSLKTDVFKGLLLILIGSFIGAFFSDDPIDSLSTTGGFLLLLIGSCGVAMLFDQKLIRSSIDLFFIVLLVYYAIYAIDITVLKGKFTSYSALTQSSSLINHHVVGMALSISSAYLAVRFNFKSKKLGLIGFMIFGIALLGCLLSESRSNFLFTLITLIVLLVMEKSSIKRLVIITVPLIIIGYYTLGFFTNKIEYLQKRFSIENMDYQVRTNKSRIAYLESAFYEILDKPFGRGINNIKLVNSYRGRLVHNQYVSFIISGGIIALIGIFYWLRNTLSVFKQVYLRKWLQWNPGISSFLYGGALSLLTFHLTLFTIDYSGMLFFIMMSLSVFTFYSIFYSDIVSDVT